MDMKTQSPESRLATLTGNEAAAEACKMARVQVGAFFPIGPSDEVGEKLVQMMRRGELDARVIDLENERSVINAQIVAAQAGVRTSFATNSEGIVFAYQPLFWAPYGRVPIVVHVAHRAMEPPTTIVTDDHDTIIFRDVHWLQFHCENAQDVFDTTLQAYRVAEDHDVLLATSAGKCIRFPTVDVRVFAGRNSTGVRGIRLAEGDDVISLSLLTHNEVDVETRDEYLRAVSARRRLEGSEYEDRPEDRARDEELAARLSAPPFADMAAERASKNVLCAALNRFQSSSSAARSARPASFHDAISSR